MRLLRLRPLAALLLLCALLTAQAAPDSRFQGFRGTPGCGDPSRITVARGTNITCQPGFTLR